ncbi:MAG: DNA polymerase III subunit gamma/tau, partial [Planctomycetaceae bacterium]|nr:DNA polymerase III subunit gamma/tau [Planctomycetaceae bacterium]
NVKSMRTKYKIYIIDEVHMLTKEAFNALLKTLEEPPPGVKFVFCTTEPQKLPDTILSRCQRFDFSTIETENISERLKQIATAEGFEVSEEAVELVARRAAGSMRDSQSLFDQLLAFGGEKITAADVHRLLGTADDERLTTLAEALIKRERREVLELLDSALSAGVQLSEFVDQLLNYMRDLMVLASHAEEVPLLSVSSSYRSMLKKQANEWGLRTVIAGLEILAEAKSRMFRASHARSLVELALVRMTMLQDLQQMETIINLLQGGKVTPVTIGETGQVSAAAQKKTEEPPLTSEEPPLVASEGPVALIQESVQVEAPNSSPPDVVQIEERPLTPVQNLQEAADFSVVSEEPEEEESITEFGEGSTLTVESGSDEVSYSEPKAELSPGNEESIFTQLIESPEVKGLPQLKSLTGLAISGPNRLDLIYPAKYDFLRQSLSRQETLNLIQKTLSTITGREIRIDFQAKEVPESNGREGGESHSPKPKASSLRPMPVEPDQVKDEFVQAAVQVFGSTRINVQKMLPES